VRHKSDSRLRLAQITLLVFTCIWGIDYLIGAPWYTLQTVEKSMPLTLWGSLLLFFGLLGLAGEVWMIIGERRIFKGHVCFLLKSANRWWPSFVAHAVLCAFCMGLGAGCVVEMVINDQLYGARIPAGLFTLAAVHWVGVQRRKHAP